MGERTEFRLWAAFGLAILGGVSVVIFLATKGENRERPSVETLEDAGTRQLGQLLATSWQETPLNRGGDLHPRLIGPNQGLFLEARSGGLLRGRVEIEPGGTVAEAAVLAINKLKESVGARSVDTLLACPVHSYRNIKYSKLNRSRIHQGVRGIELSYGKDVARYSPFEVIARNVSFEKLHREFATRVAAPENALRIGLFDCDQIWVSLDRPGEAKQLFRGNELVPIANVKRNELEKRAHLMGRWLAASVNSNGRMNYKWWPSRGQESSSNNMIRQWMASLALVRYAEFSKDKGVLALAKKNIEYNIAAFYREEDGLGLIEYNGKIKLGAMALASLAMLEFPGPDFEKVQKKLLETTLSMQRNDGSFQTMLKPVSEGDPFQNFYTGETLLLWAYVYERHEKPELLDRFMRSFRYYRNWHRERRNPAFVPWHTQANFLMWQKTKQEELADFIFETNDWLVGVQEWEKSPYPDAKGRFYDDTRRHFGKPHASSTGVYLEGLADALAVARLANDEKRVTSYKTSIRRGLRSVFQLQFTEGPGLFYISKPEKVIGGVRTRLYDNTIRVDNVQHNLLAALKMLALDPAISF